MDCEKGTVAADSGVLAHRVSGLRPPRTRDRGRVPSLRGGRQPARRAAEGDPGLPAPGRGAVPPAGRVRVPEPAREPRRAGPMAGRQTDHRARPALPPRARPTGAGGVPTPPRTFARVAPRLQ